MYKLSVYCKLIMTTKESTKTIRFKRGIFLQVLSEIYTKSFLCCFSFPIQVVSFIVSNHKKVNMLIYFKIFTFYSFFFFNYFSNPLSACIWRLQSLQNIIGLKNTICKPNSNFNLKIDVHYALMLLESLQPHHIERPHNH